MKLIRIPFTKRAFMVGFWPRASVRYDQDGRIYMILREP